MALEVRARFLEKIAENILALGEALIERAVQESGLPRVDAHREPASRADSRLRGDEQHQPVLVLPHALAARGGDIAKAFVASLTMGAGQFCTNPGIVLAQEGSALDQFVAKTAESLGACPPLRDGNLLRIALRVNGRIAGGT